MWDVLWELCFVCFVEERNLPERLIVLDLVALLRLFCAKLLVSDLPCFFRLFCAYTSAVLVCAREHYRVQLSTEGAG